MENWDEEKLKEVVEKKHGENERKMPKTDIVSFNTVINIFVHKSSFKHPYWNNNNKKNVFDNPSMKFLLMYFFFNCKFMDKIILFFKC